MFAVMVAGRLAQTQFEQISETQFVFTIPEADSINHLVVFMTGASPFPEGLGAQVYFSWPEPNAPPTWLLLGHISNVKPSAIFKISSLKGVENSSSEGFTPSQFGQQQFSHLAQIGISVENVFAIEQSSPVSAAQPSKASKYVEFTQKLLNNFFNFMSSFGVTQQEMIANPHETYVPMSKMQMWFTNMQRRLLHNPDFLV